MDIDLFFTPQELAKHKPFKWRTAHEGDIDPKNMVTRHLFMTLRLIWNSTMPRSAYVTSKRGPEAIVTKFTNPVYTQEYLKQSIFYLAVELSKRTDMTPDWKEQLDQMLNWLKTGRIETPQSQEKITCKYF